MPASRLPTASRASRVVELTRYRVPAAELLMLYPRRVLPAELIYDRIWEHDFGPAGDALVGGAVLRIWFGSSTDARTAGEPRLERASAAR